MCILVISGEYCALGLMYRRFSMEPGAVVSYCQAFPGRGSEHRMMHSWLACPGFRKGVGGEGKWCLGR